MKKIIKKFPRNAWIWILIAVCIAIKLFMCPIQVSGNSMSPTYKNGQILLATVSGKGNIARGDVVVFREKETNTIMIKRVIGLPGDEVKITSKGIFINENKFVDIFTESMDFPTVGMNFWRLGESEYFVLGDNRNDSMDSRVYGCINKKQILYKVYGTLNDVSEISAKEQK